jgi:hypothetical protein
MNVLGKPGRAKKDFSSFRALDHSTPFSAGRKLMLIITSTNR